MGRFLFTASIAVWLGTVISFSFVFLPTIHTVLSDRATGLLNSLFPRYYMLGILCGITALAAVSLAPSTALSVGERMRLAFPVVVSLLCTLVADRVLLPRLAALDRRDPSYERLHRFSAMLNTTVLAMLILATAAVTTR